MSMLLSIHQNKYLYFKKHNSVRIYRPRFRENKPKNWAHKFRHRNRFISNRVKIIEKVSLYHSYQRSTSCVSLWTARNNADARMPQIVFL
jgi:hypothetical protein